MEEMLFKKKGLEGRSMSSQTKGIGSISGEHFTRRVVLPMAAMIIISIFTVGGFVFMTSSGQNEIAVESSTALAQTALQVKTTRDRS